ncbi:hypothetical protein EDB81DRAFT_494816 [Dactylonectria macrodidyma]|uniref:Uncharacterized protein n=1 Tax=Dactylonectria macrodidyma TaxID=307937 RepID=A0A9P9EXL5_9HYPO|nr:hypothetical protein EDB81DRAFT_494816 [Dactylonectria macrodidyma]
MPSGKKSWFARHCAPPPPINNTSACPCASCYNVGTHSASHGSSSYSYTYSYVSSTSQPMDPRTGSLRSTDSSDSASIGSASTVTTSTHVEHHCFAAHNAHIYTRI